MIIPAVGPGNPDYVIMRTFARDYTFYIVVWTEPSFSTTRDRQKKHSKSTD